MLVQADDVEAEFLGVQVLVDEVVIVFGRALAIEVAIRDGEVSAVAQYHILGNPSRRPFGEIPYLHSYLALDYQLAIHVTLLGQKPTDYSHKLS